MSENETKVVPALSAEEWANDWFKFGSGFGGKPQVRVERDRYGLYLEAEENVGALLDGAARHALAALALHGQPFGFTREDANLIRGAVNMPIWPWPHMRDQWLALADRIETLLPPA